LFKSASLTREWISKRREEIRPWGTFVKTTNFEAPSRCQFHKHFTHVTYGRNKIS
jgi:hypothetical protein